MEVKEMTIADVLKTPLFFENVKRQLTSLWNDREKARKDATRNNTKLIDDEKARNNGNGDDK